MDTVYLQRNMARFGLFARDRRIAIFTCSDFHFLAFANVDHVNCLPKLVYFTLLGTAMAVILRGFSLLREKMFCLVMKAKITVAEGS